jgi:hypothetical protein
VIHLDWKDREEERSGSLLQKGGGLYLHGRFSDQISDVDLINIA